MDFLDRRVFFSRASFLEGMTLLLCCGYIEMGFFWLGTTISRY